MDYYLRRLGVRGSYMLALIIRNVAQPSGQLSPKLQRLGGLAGVKPTGQKIRPIIVTVAITVTEPAAYKGFNYYSESGRNKQSMSNLV